MIMLYSGTPGSGKSLHLASNIWTRLRYGRSVIANFPVNLEILSESFITYLAKKLKLKYRGKEKKLGKFTYFDMSEMTVDNLEKYAKEHHVPNKENQTLLIIDECAVIFNSRGWDAKDRMRWIIFFQQHRKLGFNVILVSQHDRMIDRQIRGFVEYEIKHLCVNNFKLFGIILGLLSGGKVFVANKYWYGMREKVGSDFFRLNRRHASIYNTFQIFTSGSA
jgi:zona occludens toxin